MESGDAGAAMCVGVTRTSRTMFEVCLPVGFLLRKFQTSSLQRSLKISEKGLASPSLIDITNQPDLQANRENSFVALEE